MLLSIDRVLQLLSEGKSIEKIAELAQCEDENVIEVINKARTIINKYEKPIARKKIKIRKSNETENNSSYPDSKKIDADRELTKVLSGAELSAVPVDSSLTMYIKGVSDGNSEPAGIAVIIHDSDDHQVGKVSSYAGRGSKYFAEYSALVRALKIAMYFKTQKLRILTDSEMLIKQVQGELEVNHNYLKKLYNEALSIIDEIKNFKIEYVSKNFNDKAYYLACKGIEFYNNRKK